MTSAMAHDSNQPAAWLASHAGLLPSSGAALDVACGRGRHALWLAERGLRVRAVDRDPAAIAAVRDAAAARGVVIDAELVDLEVDELSLRVDAFDLIVVVHYLHRAMFPALRAALRPGGLLVYETFTRAQALRGRPTNPAFLLEPGELARLVAPLEIVDAREGEFEGRDLASVVARRVG